jgi:ketosteroid isomerase-like protein
MSGTGPTIGILAACNAHDPDGIMAFCAEDVLVEMPHGPHPGARGRRVLPPCARCWRRGSLPDGSYHDDTHHVAGTLGVSNRTPRGTEAGTGRRIEVRGCDLLTFRCDKVVRKDSYWKIVRPTPG